MNGKDSGTIVVGVDGSEHGERALDWAIEEAKLRGARLVLLSAWHVPASVYGAPGFAPQLDGRMDKPFEDVAEEVADAAAKRARRRARRPSRAFDRDKPRRSSSTRAETLTSLSSVHAATAVLPASCLAP
jgi:nucleotide-binding universal stress UspA family protein